MYTTIHDTQPRSNQIKYIDQIINAYQSRVQRSCSVYLYGPPGVGKSMVALFVAKRLNAAYINNYNKC